MSEPDNLVLAHLREFRAAMDACFQAVERRFDGLEGRFDKIERRLEMMHANCDKALRQLIGYRAMVEGGMASFEVEMREVKRRLELLEATPS